ncbi:hypothetical protein L798_10162 [Zootermopsis nevadensis]|uniref:Uncharacterized protein n=1 Tax=Zootermopsis nevadensis TaxID=136037 RepID=A0A067R1J4_ZOONE|nr:hypothetical protein L798_10162 [Zootermopsis nevadensis]
MADYSIHEQLLEPEIILTVKQEEEVDHCSSSSNFSTIQNYKYTLIKMDSSDKLSAGDVSCASHFGNKLRLIKKT